MNFDFLYKFHTVSDKSKSALSSKSIWFSTQESLNDPFEGITKSISPSNETEKISKSLTYMGKLISLERGIDKITAMNIVFSEYLQDPDGVLKAIVNQAMMEHNSEIEKTKAMGIYSTSSDIPGDQRSHVANMIMWSLYGDSFNGFCIKYNAKELYRSLNELNIEDNFAYTKVKYVTEPHGIDIFSIVQKGNFDYIRALQRKHEQWQHECECRLICNTTGLKKISSESIEAVYFGDKISPENERNMIDIIESHFPKADICRVKLDDNSYGIRVGKKCNKKIQVTPTAHLI